MIPLEKVSGMALIPAAKDVGLYVPLTGREPLLQEDGPAWVIQITGDVQQRGSEIWTDPTCIVTAGDFGFYATGPVKNTSTGSTSMPEAPKVPPNRSLPPLAP